MRFSFTEDQRLFASTLRDLLSKECPATRVRAAWDDGTGHAPDVWAQLAALGLLGLLVPEGDGGGGGDEIDLVLLLIELGRAGVPGPVLEHAAIVAPALAGTPWARRLATGELVATAWLDGPYVPHAGGADLILTSEGAIETAQVSRTEVEALDGGRRLFVVDGAAPIEVAALDLELARDRAALAAAAVLIGLAARLIELAADHARQRHQFGRPIGSFQAVKHLLADTSLELEMSKAIGLAAARRVGTYQPDAASVASMAKAFVGDCSIDVAQNCFQVFGGIGYTWEHDQHLFLRRLTTDSALYGEPAWHRERVCQLAGL